MAEKLEWNNFLRNVAEYLGLEENEIKTDTHIYNDLGIDSLGLFSLGMFMVKTYEIKIPMSTVSTITTIGNLYEAMNRCNSDK